MSVCECVCLCTLFKSSKTNICLLLYLGENYESASHSVLLYSLQPHGLFSPRNSPGQNTGLGSLSLLQGIFPTQGSNPGLPHCRRILYQLSHQGSPDSRRQSINTPAPLPHARDNSPAGLSLAVPLHGLPPSLCHILMMY